MNYTIAGQDGKLYGPVGADQIRQWIGQGRVDSRTPIFKAGATDWTFAGLVPELTAQFSTTPPTMTALKGGVGELPRNNSFAVWGLVCGILSWTCCCCFPISLMGLVFSIVGLMQIQAKPEVQQGRGLAIAGLVLSGLNLLWCAASSVLNMVASAQPDMFNLNGFN